MEDFTTCQICFIQYDEKTKTPRNLQCGHTFCQECLQKTFKSQQIKCFICRQETTAKIEDLSKNFILLQIINDQTTKQIKQQQQEQNNNNNPKNLPIGSRIRKPQIPQQYNQNRCENINNNYNANQSMIYISNISPVITEKQLKQILERHIQIESIQLKYNPKVNLQFATVKTVKPRQKQILWKVHEQDPQFQQIFLNKPYIVYAKSKEQVQIQQNQPKKAQKSEDIFQILTPPKPILKENNNKTNCIFFRNIQDLQLNFNAFVKLGLKSQKIIYCQLLEVKVGAFINNLGKQCKFQKGIEKKITFQLVEANYVPMLNFSSNKLINMLKNQQLLGKAVQDLFKNDITLDLRELV